MSSQHAAAAPLPGYHERVTSGSTATGLKKVLFRFGRLRIRVYFIGIRSLFSFILLIIQHHDYVMYWCGVHWVLCGRFGLFIFVIQTNEDEDNAD